MVSACVLVRAERGKFESVTELIKQFKEVKRAFPVLGRYDVVVDLEVEDFETLGNVVLRIGKLSGAVFTETLIEILTKEG